ncbi:hypothetical protein QBC39DRAFT_383841 [Podospora conica]|nr:hypothetical protein QBC39DRAFT_383841 [Schizothecium conicum]
MGPGWESFHRLKEHIYRNHSPNTTCIRCSRSFDSAKHLKDHRRAPTLCQVSNMDNWTTRPDDITDEQLREVIKLRSSDESEQEAWEDLYRVIFPDEMSIPSPYCNPPAPLTTKGTLLRLSDLAGHDAHAPFTDSGYASGPIEAKTAVAQSHHLLRLPEGPDESNTAAQRSIIEEDAKTLYSAATSLDPVCSRRYIHELSQNLYRNLQAQSDQLDWGHVSQALPDLIKTFAAKIGQGGDSQVYLDIMYFVHKRHRDIIHHLEHLFQDDRLDNKKEDPDSMSLLDKMSLWNRKGAEEGPEADPTDLFEGVTDVKEDDQIEESVDLSSYNKIVLGCSAYSWLISQLQKQCRLQFGEAQTSTFSGIRRSILEALPSVAVSKRRPPQKHAVAFRFPWDPLLRRFQTENSQQDLNSGIGGIITTTLASPDEVQLATVGDYFRQTWPLGGEEFLQVFGAILEALGKMAGPEKHIDYGPVSFLNQTTVHAVVRGSLVVLLITGLADSVAEYGEQLAWLTSALRPARQQLSVSAIPVLRQWPQRGLETSELCSFLEPEKASSKVVDPKQGTNRQPNPRSLAAGFDIEICEQLNPIHSSKAPLGWCSRLLPEHFAPVFAEGFPIARRPENGLGLELPFQILQRIRNAGTGICGPTDESARTWTSVGVKLSHKLGGVFYWSLSSVGSCGPGNGVDFELSELETGRHILQDDCPDDTDKIETPPKSLQSSSLESPTIDMVSLSSDSEQVGRRDFNSPGFRFFKQLFGRILVVYQAGTNGADSPGSGATTTSAVSGPNPSSLVPSTQSRKRNRLSRTPLGEEDEDDETPKAKRVKKEQPDFQRPRYFACPFWKLDPNKHWECILKKMTSISYVKQHLLRRHTPDFYCHRCYATFPDGQTYDQHVLQATCFRDESVTFEGVTQQQSRNLSKKVAGTVETQWFAMWKISGEFASSASGVVSAYSETHSS